VLKDRAGLLVEGLEAGTEGVLVVIRALDEGLTSDVVLALNLGGVELDVVAAAGSLVDTAAGDALDKNLVVNLEVDNVIDLLALLGKNLVEHLGLLHVAGESIEEETLGTGRGVDVLLDETDDKVIIDELASLHDALSLEAERGASSDSLAEHVTGSQVAGTVVEAELGALGTLATSCSILHDIRQS